MAVELYVRENLTIFSQDGSVFHCHKGVLN